VDDGEAAFFVKALEARHPRAEAVEVVDLP